MLILSASAILSILVTEVFTPQAWEQCSTPFLVCRKKCPQLLQVRISDLNVRSALPILFLVSRVHERLFAHTREQNRPVPKEPSISLLQLSQFMVPRAGYDPTPNPYQRFMLPLSLTGRVSISSREHELIYWVVRTMLFILCLSKQVYWQGMWESNPPCPVQSRMRSSDRQSPIVLARSPGIEPGSCPLQGPAMTTSAKNG